MRKISRYFAIFSLTVLIVSCGGADDVEQGSRFDNATQEMLTEFAQCLTQKGVVMYGTSKCSACRAQRKTFGEAFQHIQEVECDPHAVNTQVDRCLAKNIRKTPTWIIEIGGKEYGRLQGYQLLEDIAEFTECDV